VDAGAGGLLGAGGMSTGTLVLAAGAAAALFLFLRD
jgi:hypothetical protein